MHDRVSTGINGMGRFGLHLLQYWIEHYDNAHFSIDYINDDYLTLDKIEGIIQNDKYLRLKSYLSFTENAIVVQLPGGNVKSIPYTNTDHEAIAWLGKPSLFLECSGKHTKKTDWHTVLTGATKHVIISATSWTADQILVYGFNHANKKNGKAEVVSYGSCTVNAYVPLAQLIHENYGVIDSDVNVIHNVPVHQIDAFDTLERKGCTLEVVAPHLLEFLTADNFVVNYTLVPYSGVSMLDYRFRIKSDVSEEAIKSALKNAVTEGKLKGLYALAPSDQGPDEHKFTSYSAVLIEPSIKRVGDNIYINAYFDNENSVNRYFDLANYFTEEV